MDRPGWNPVRRNRNIGTAKQGYGQNNEFSIPCRADRDYWTDLTKFIVVEKQIDCNDARRGKRSLTFLLEEVRAPFYYPLTPDDISVILSAVAPDLWEDLGLFVFRQCKRKELTLNSTWGRMAYYADVGPHPGPAVIINSQQVGDFSWSKSLSRDGAQELERLRADGHVVVQNARNYEINTTPSSIRNTVLYRTLLHEIGHWHDYLEKVQRPSQLDKGTDLGALEDLYHSRPTLEKEDYAHKFAHQQRESLRKAGIIPFETNLDRLKEDGLSADWFVPRS